MTPDNAANLPGHTAVVTGASGGIGQAIARELARAGAAVLVHGHSHRDAAEALVAEIKAAGGVASLEMADFSDPATVDRFADAAWQWRGRVDILVNAAGADILTGQNAKEEFEAKLARLWQIDVLGTIRLGRRLGEQMKQAGRGCILNIGWDGADRGMAGPSGELFAAAKGAVMAFTRSLAQSLAPEVRVNCLALGWIETAWGRQASQEWRDRAAAESLAGRWGTPDDVARAACFLASPSAEFIDGQVIAVNGGFDPTGWAGPRTTR